MIEKTQSYKASDGEVFEHLADAQRHEIEALLKPAASGKDIQVDVAAKAVVDCKDKIIDILTTGPRSKPAARKINGARRVRTPKSATATT